MYLNYTHEQGRSVDVMRAHQAAMPPEPSAAEGFATTSGKNEKQINIDTCPATRILLDDFERNQGDPARWAEKQFFEYDEPERSCVQKNPPPPEKRAPEAKWKSVQEAQEAVAREVPNCGFIETRDIGSKDNIHFPNKKPVGERLAAWALNTAIELG